MSHLSSPPEKHKGERKGHRLPRGSERWVGLGTGGSRRGARGQGGVRWASGGGVGGGGGDSSPDLPAHDRGSSSQDKDRSVTVGSSVPMSAGGKGSRTNCSRSTPQKVPNRLIDQT